MIEQAGEDDSAEEAFSSESLNCETSVYAAPADDSNLAATSAPDSTTEGPPPRDGPNSGDACRGHTNSPSYMRLSCALSGYHNASTPRSHSSSGATPGRPLYLTERLQTPSPAPASASSTEKISPSDCAPMTIREIVESFNRLSLSDNTPALRLLASCQAQEKSRRNSLEDAQGDKAAGDQMDKATSLPNGSGDQSKQPEVARAALVGPVTIVPPDEVLRTIIDPEFYKNMATFERYRLESLCNRLESRLGGRLPSEVRSQTAALVENIKVLLSGRLKSFETQLESERVDGGRIDEGQLAELEKSWNTISASIQGIDGSLEGDDEFDDIHLTSMADKEAMTGNGSVASSIATDGQRVDGVYYQQLANQNRNRVEEQCKVAEEDLELVTCEEACDRIRMAVGKAKLLLKKKFKKFEELVGKHLNPVDGEPNVTLDDLQGFWSLVEIELADIESCFEAVKKLKENNWTAVNEEPPPEPVANVAKKPTIQKIVSGPKKLWLNKRVTEARQRVREAKLLAKQRMMNGQDA